MAKKSRKIVKVHNSRERQENIIYSLLMKYIEIRSNKTK